MKYTIFTDGSSRGNPGPGGWGAIVVSGENGGAKIKELGGREAHTTNNRMELTAVAKGLRYIPADSNVTVYSDSSYVINGITKWINGWKRNGWKTKTKDDVLNKDLWIEISEAVSGHTIDWKYVGGHVGVAGNERCDEIATGFADKDEVDLYEGNISGYKIKNILDISHDVGLATAKKESSSRSRAKAFSYVSCVKGIVKVHQDWADCEKVVKGLKGVKYRKVLDKAEEIALVEEWRK